MDIKEFKKVKIVNTANMRIVTHAFSLAHGQEVIVETRELPEHILKDLNIFHERGHLEFVEVNYEPEKVKVVKHTETRISETGKEHTVFKPQENKLINVEAIDTSGKGINVGFSKMDAVDLLSKHWKTLEKEVEGIDSLESLKLILATAVELDMEGNKKYELVKDRISKIEK